MGYWLRFYVPASLDDLATGGKPFWTPTVLSLQSDSSSFIAQIFPLAGYDEPIVRRRPLYEGFRLGHPEVPEGITQNVRGVPLYYVRAGDVAKVKVGRSALPLDRAMMAYIRALPPKHPLVPYVVY